jgi:Acetyltransferases
MLTLRPASSSDAERLTLIGLAAWEVAITAWGEDLEKLRTNAWRAYADFCATSWTDITVAEWDGEPAGWGACENAEDEISDLWVLPAYQGRGIGTRLIEELEEQIRARGYHQARIATHARNVGAIRLYKALGYRVTSYAVSYEASLDTDIDKVEMLKSFDDVDAREAEVEGDDWLYGNA